VLHTRDSVLKPECDRVAVIATELHEVLRRGTRLRLSSLRPVIGGVVRRVGLRLMRPAALRPSALASTNSRALGMIDLAVLRQYAVGLREI